MRGKGRHGHQVSGNGVCHSATMVFGERPMYIPMPASRKGVSLNKM